LVRHHLPESSANYTNEAPYKYLVTAQTRAIEKPRRSGSRVHGDEITNRSKGRHGPRKWYRKAIGSGHGNATGNERHGAAPTDQAGRWNIKSVSRRHARPARPIRRSSAWPKEICRTPAGRIPFTGQVTDAIAAAATQRLNLVSRVKPALPGVNHPGRDGLSWEGKHGSSTERTRRKQIPGPVLHSNSGCAGRIRIPGDRLSSTLHIVSYCASKVDDETLARDETDEAQIRETGRVRSWGWKRFLTSGRRGPADLLQLGIASPNITGL